MLTGDLVQVRIKGKTIQPRLVPPDDPRLLELAGTILGAFHEACAEAATRGHLTGRLRELAAERTDHKLIGGLGKVLLDQCDFDTVSPLPPAELRALLADFDIEALVPTHYALSGPFEAAAGLLEVEEALALEARLAAHPISRPLNRAWTVTSRLSEERSSRSI